jgi:hypothetical protein
MIAEAFMVVVDLLGRLGRRWDDAVPGCLELDIDEHWHVSLNGDRDRRASAVGTMVPGLTFAVTYDGTPIAVVSPAGGVFISGIRDVRGSAERAFIQACKAAGPQREPSEPVPQPQQMLLGGIA